VVLYIALVATGGCADLLLYFPSTRTIKPPAGADRHLVPWDDHKQVEIWSMRSPGALQRPPEAFVLIFAGQGDRVEPLISKWINRWGDRAVEGWAVNLPGFGGTSGPGKLRYVPSAALAAFDALTQAAHGRPVFISANSLGTTAALYVASQRPVAGLIIQSPPPLHEIILRRYGWWNLWLAAGPIAAGVPSDLEAIPHAKQIHAPAVFLMTDGDWYVTPKYQQMVIDAYAGPKQIVHLKGNHNAVLDRAAEALFQRGLDWLIRCSKNATTQPGSDRKP
jgi:pimeloyl-ACP methyl ester carboxylesterase